MICLADVLQDLPGGDVLDPAGVDSGTPILSYEVSYADKTSCEAFRPEQKDSGSCKSVAERQ
jgi:hypothetical protein